MRILSLAPLAGPGLDALRALGEVELDPWSAHIPIKLHTPDELLARLDGVEVLIVEADIITAEALDGSGLRVLGACRGDPNNIDLAAAARNGITVVNTPGRNAGAVAELTIGLMLACLRGIVAADADVRAARWIVDEALAQQRYLGRELGSCTVGLVGCGAVGRATARMLHGFGARVRAFDPFADADALAASSVELVPDLPALVAGSDILSVHAPLNEATRGLVDAAAFAAMRPGTIVVNTARYPIVDEEALLAALADGRVRAAGFDHFPNEFLPPDHPLIGMPNVVLTPHIGGATVETIEVQTAMVAEGIAAALQGEAHPTHVRPA